jgi:methionyl-tRNA synthetase
MEDFINNNPILFTWIIVILSFWSAVWKGLALWRSARLKQVAWFVVIMIINTAGILEIIYLLTHKKHHHENKDPEKAE